MKKIKYLLPILFVSLNVYAATVSSVKHVNIPFESETIQTSTNNGLSFNYQLVTGKITNKIVCKLSNVYKSWLEFSDGSAMQSTVFGGEQTVVLSSVEKTHDESESRTVYHVDASGSVKVMDIRKNQGTASCHYEEDQA